MGKVLSRPFPQGQIASDIILVRFLEKKYLLDPLTAPEPSQKTGRATYHNTTPPRPRLSSSLSHDSATARRASDSSRTSQPPPAYTLPHHDGFPNYDRPSQRRSIGQESSVISTSTTPTPSNRLSTDRASTAIPTSPTGQSSRFSEVGSSGSRSQRHSIAQASSTIPTSLSSRRRKNSLLSRFEGDQSHRPLEIIKRDTRLANRAPHLRKEHHVGPDTIDSLDTVGGAYHHEGPFDATLLARNFAVNSSPVAAVRESNIEALKATPREMIHDSLRSHRPLDGVALVPPGMPDRYGQVYDYEEKNLIIEGDYKRWPGIVRFTSGFCCFHFPWDRNFYWLLAHFN